MDKKRKSKFTPLQVQIIEFKRKHLDKLLIFDAGYKYKLYAQDAVVASNALNCNLTPGWANIELNDPNDYLYKSFASVTINETNLKLSVKGLISRGFKVGIISIIKDKLVIGGGGVFEKELTNVYSSGTYIDENLNEGVKSISCLIENKQNHTFSLFSINVFLGEIVYDEFQDTFAMNELNTRLKHLEPIEIIVIGSMSLELTNCLNSFKISSNNELSRMIRIVSMKEEGDFNYNEIIKSLESQFDDKLFSFLINLNEGLLKCFHFLNEYLREFKLNKLLNNLELFTSFNDIKRGSIKLDSCTIKDLEIFQNLTDFSDRGSLFSFLNITKSLLGKRELIQWIKNPLIDKELIFNRHCLVESIINKLEGSQIKRVNQLLSKCIDLKYIQIKSYHLNATRFEVYQYLKNLEDISDIFKTSNINLNLYSKDALGGTSDFSKMFSSLIDLLNSEDINYLKNLKSMIFSPAAIDLKDTKGHIIDYFNKNLPGFNEIETLKNEIFNVKSRLNEILKEIKMLLKKPNLKWSNSSQGNYLITVKSSEINRIPSEWKEICKTKNSSSFQTIETKIELDKLNKLESDLISKSNEIFKFKFLKKINSKFTYVNKLVKLISEFDILISFANLSVKFNLTKPILIDKPNLNLINNKNPILQFINLNYIPNDINFLSNSMSLIYGPNMGGKSSLMRSVGLNVIMNQIGCFVACDENSMIGIFENIFVRFGSNDDLINGKSTFEVELLNCKRIFDFLESNPKKSCLLLFDELGSGTSTIDGYNITKSILSYLLDFDNILTILITHFKDLSILELKSNGKALNFNMGFKLIKSDSKTVFEGDDKQIKIEDKNNLSNDLMFTYKLQRGASNGSFGIYCGLLAGIDEEILNKAGSISLKMELDSEVSNLAYIGNQLDNKKITELLQNV